ncbi:MAG: hypothetical protein WBP44_06220, partial [Gammaproteobacteria bacterium]
IIFAAAVNHIKIATESTEEHGKINTLQEIISCSSVDSVAIQATLKLRAGAEKNPAPTETGD